MSETKIFYSINIHRSQITVTLMKLQTLHNLSFHNWPQLCCYFISLSELCEDSNKYFLKSLSFKNQIHCAHTKAICTQYTLNKSRNWIHTSHFSYKSRISSNINHKENDVLKWRGLWRHFPSGAILHCCQVFLLESLWSICQLRCVVFRELQ